MIRQAKFAMMKASLRFLKLSTCASLAHSIVITVLEPNVTNPRLHSSLVHSTEVFFGNLSGCDVQFIKWLEKQGLGSRADERTWPATYVNPQVHIDLSDQDETSERVLGDSESWHMCFSTSVPRGNQTSMCANLLPEVTHSIVAGCCSGFGASPRGLGLSLDVWLEHHPAAAATAEGHKQESSGGGGGGSDSGSGEYDTNTDINSSSSSEGAVAIIGQGPRHASQRFDYSVLPARESHRTNEGGGTFSLSLPVPSGLPATIHGLRRNGMSFSEYYQRAEAFAREHHLTANDGSSEETVVHRVMDQMMSHLSEPRLCVRSGTGTGDKNRERLARIVVIGDTHTGVFQAGSHYHEYGGGDHNDGTNGDSSDYVEENCLVSNYMTRSIIGSTAHGLGNINSTLQAGPGFLSAVRYADILAAETAAATSGGGVGGGRRRHRTNTEDGSSRDNHPGSSSTIDSSSRSNSGASTSSSSSNAAPLAHMDYVVVVLGERDLRWVAAARKQSKGVTMLEQIKTSAAELVKWCEEKLVQDLGLSGLDRVILVGAALLCPSNIHDDFSGASRYGDAYFGDYFLEAVPATLRFNAELTRLCRERGGSGGGCRMASAADDLLDWDKGRVHSYFWSQPREMHCSVRQYFFWHRAVMEAAPKRGLDWCADYSGHTSAGEESEKRPPVSSDLATADVPTEVPPTITVEQQGADPLELYPMVHSHQAVWGIRFKTINIDLGGEDVVSQRVRAEPEEWSLCLQMQPAQCSFEATCFPLLKLPTTGYFQVPLCLRESSRRHVNFSAWLQRTPPCNQDIQVGDHNGHIDILVEGSCAVANTSFVRSFSAPDSSSSHLTSKIQGGLGNQLFIVFSSIAYSRRFDTTLDFDDEFFSTSDFRFNKYRHLYWTSLLDGVQQFTSKPPPDSKPSVVLRETRYQLPPAPPPVGHVGFSMKDFFQSPIYFQEHEQYIFNLLDFPAKRTATCTHFFKTLPEEEDFVTISVHFRFGDYQIIGGRITIQPVSYYRDALHRIVEQLSPSSLQQQVRVLVFTDGDFFGDAPLSTATHYVTELEAAFPAMRFEFVSNHLLEDFEQLLVMSCCDHHVIASSTFSWWGAYIHRALREETADAPLVAYPATWFGPHNPMALEEDYEKRFPGEWIKAGYPV